ncbi:MAG: adenylosuccinate synthase [Thermoanaerobaculaceae bacterium]|nr:adenylosuccinate synthase [Thermoanaerobaculaceae bacterium]MDI9622032.1 adenylosuccinate synthase [Acidobacteriota bacterium]NLH11768.1 adenylosuccinate synthase [Holophagae bacterium]HPW54822.1 adenylosuccinate synthase [Thermoanaerobaculaceae bacterium]
MANVVVIGGQWGDEGKGKVVDILCPAFTDIVRFNGGNNAGHTVRFGDRHFALHIVPSGILQPGCRCLVGPGVVVDPVGLGEEIRSLEEQGISVRPRLVLSSRCHLVLPGHRALDLAREGSRPGGKLGTTGKGVGPTYESRAARTGVRLGTVRQPRRFRDAVLAASQDLERLLGAFPGATVPTSAEIDRWLEAALALAPMVGDVATALHPSSEPSRSILFEGAQGTLLDLDHGSYPFVTSSGCLAGFAAPACGLPARTIGGVLGVFKAYTTRVGSGPFPTELEDAMGEHLRRRGNEFGTTTGRPRRTGWFDAVAAAAAMRWNGIEAIALTKLDVLDEVAEIRLAVRYKLGSEELRELPDDSDDLAHVEPVYETLPGWQAQTSGVTSFSRLPERARSYVERLEELLGAPAVMISTGPRREETILRPVPPLRDWLPDDLLR